MSVTLDEETVSHKDQVFIPIFVPETDPEINNDVIPNIPQEQDNIRFLPQAPPIGQTQKPQDPPLRRSTRERKSSISDDYVVFLQECEDDIGLIEEDPINFS